jgi:hypothetical protein
MRAQIEKVKVSRDTEMPTFVVRLWDVRKHKLEARGHNVTSKGLSKRFAKHYFAGRIEYVGKKKKANFNSVSQLLAFIEKYRV